MKYHSVFKGNAWLMWNTYRIRDTVRTCQMSTSQTAYVTRVTSIHKTETLNPSWKLPRFEWNLYDFPWSCYEKCTRRLTLFKTPVYFIIKQKFITNNFRYIKELCMGIQNLKSKIQNWHADLKVRISKLLVTRDKGFEVRVSQDFRVASFALAQGAS